MNSFTLVLRLEVAVDEFVEVDDPRPDDDYPDRENEQHKDADESMLLFHLHAPTFLIFVTDSLVGLIVEP